MVVKHHRLGREVGWRDRTVWWRKNEYRRRGHSGRSIIGIINPGLFAIGDTISVTGGFNFKPLPQFQPEIFCPRFVRPMWVSAKPSTRAWGRWRKKEPYKSCEA